MNQKIDKFSEDTGCCLDPKCPTLQCPEPICAMEFPGGVKALLRFKRMKEILSSGADIDTAAKELGIHVSNARIWFKKIQS